MNQTTSPLNPAMTIWPGAGENQNEPRLQVWCTPGSLEEVARLLAADLTLDGERVLFLEASTGRDAQSTRPPVVPAAANLEVIHVRSTGDLQAALWTVLQNVNQGPRVRRVLMSGVLEHLHGNDLLTREAARSLGRLKLTITAMLEAGVDVVAVCREATGSLGARAYLLSSLCAVADDVRIFPSTAEKDVDRPASAIA